MANEIHIKSQDLSRVIKKLSRYSDDFRKDYQKNMIAATKLVWNLARARRPKISAAKQKELGKDAKGYRVSNPYSEYGVPVKTGYLQSQIKWEVKGTKNMIGRVFVEVPYAKYMEYGTSKIEARPFMRPALHKNIAAIYRLLRTKRSK